MQMSIFRNLWCVRTNKGGWASADVFRSRGGGGQFFAIWADVLYERSLMLNAICKWFFVFSLFLFIKHCFLDSLSLYFNKEFDFIAIKSNNDPVEYSQNVHCQPLRMGRIFRCTPAKWNVVWKCLMASIKKNAVHS